MSKKINEARKHLTKALKKHAEVVSGNAVSRKKAERAAGKVAAAATAYAALVEKKTGLASPFQGVEPVGLEAETLASLEAERDKLSTRPIPTVPSS